MHRLFWRSATATCLLLCLAGRAAAFSDADIQALLGRIDAAALNRDAEAIGDALSDDVRVVIEMPTASGSMQIELNKDQYLDVLSEGWRMIGPSYRFRRDATEITRNGEVAQVISVVHEAFEAEGETMGTRTLEIADIAMQKGRLVVIKVVGQAYVEDRDRPAPGI